MKVFYEKYRWVTVAAAILLTSLFLFLKAPRVSVPPYEVTQTESQESHSEAKNGRDIPSKEIKTLEEVPAAQVLINKVSWQRSDKIVGKTRTVLSCRLFDPKPNPKLIGIASQGRVLKVEDSQHNYYEGDASVLAPNIIQNSDSSRSFDLSMLLPDDVEKVLAIDASVVLYVAHERRIVYWDELNNANDYLRTDEGFEFLISEYRKVDNDVFVAVECRVPLRRAGEPRLGLGQFFELSLENQEGNSVKLLSATSASLDEKTDSVKIFKHYRLGASEIPKELKLLYYTGVGTEDFKFTLKEVELIKNELVTPKASVGPRGVPQLEIDGFKFLIQMVEQKSGIDPALRIGLFISCPKSVNVVGIPMNLEGVEAKDDLDKIIRVPQRKGPFVFPSEKGASIVVELRGISADADRLVSLKATYKVQVSGSLKTLELPLVEGQSTPEGSLVALRSIVRSQNATEIKLELADEAFVNGIGRQAVLFELVDGTQSIAKAQSTSFTYDKDRKKTLYQLAVSNTGREFEKVKVSYPENSRFLEIPFEFKDIGIPRKIGKIDPKGDF